MPTPNDTRLKQFFTALAMTALFAIGLLISWGLWYVYHCLLQSDTYWIQWCGVAVQIGFWVNNLIFVALTVLSMLDWMRATHGRRESRPIHPCHSSHVHPREIVIN